MRGGLSPIHGVSETRYITVVRLKALIAGKDPRSPKRKGSPMRRRSRMFLRDEGFWVGLVDHQLHRLSPASIMSNAQQVKPLSNIVKCQLILLRALAKSSRCTVQQLPLQ